MAWVNLSVLALGGLLAGIPIVLHLVMRQQPRLLVFPAIQFVKRRKEANRRRLRLRHWLLLLLRCLAIGALAIALARPSAASALVGNWLIAAVLAMVLVLAIVLTAAAALAGREKLLVGGLGTAAGVVALALLGVLATTLSQGAAAPLGDRQAPVAAALVIDTSPRMQYRHENRTRLEAARDTADWLLRQLPADSRAAVLESRAGGYVFAVDLAAAQKALAGLEPTASPRPLVHVLEDALQLLAESDKPRKELYIFTDLTQAAWQGENTSLLRDRLAAARDVLVHVIDVGVAEPRNFALGELELSGQVLAQSSELRVRTELSAIGDGGERTVELLLEEHDPDLPVVRDGKAQLPAARRRSRGSFQVEAGGAAAVELRVRGMPVGTHQGQVRIVGQDGLPFDDVRYFTVEVRHAWPVLAAGGPGSEMSLFTEAIAPYQFRETGQARFRCDEIPWERLADRDLSGYAAVCLLDPPPMDGAMWSKLSAFARDGGGVAVFLGRNAQPVSAFNVAEAGELLPGKLRRQFHSFGRETYLAPRSLDHAVLAPFRAIETQVPWHEFPVYTHWDFEALLPQATTIAAYSNGRPAIVERAVGSGLVLTTTTPLSDPMNLAGRPPWNELPAVGGWPYFILSNEIMLHLVQSGTIQLNYLAGMPASLPAEGSADRQRYQLFTPRGDWQEMTSDGGRITVAFTDVPGPYRVKSNTPGGLPRGFSVNVPESASRLARATTDRLDEVLGGGRYHFAANRDEIHRGIGEAREGREFYPYLLLLVVLVLGLEHLLANRFYKPAAAEGKPSALADREPTTTEPAKAA
jgi:hypothetical protein